MAVQIEGVRGGGATAAAPSAPQLRPPEAASIGPPDEVGLVFEVNQKSRDLVIKVVDRRTQRVIREIPPEEMQRLRASMQSMLGLQLDRTG